MQCLAEKILSGRLLQFMQNRPSLTIPDERTAQTGCRSLTALMLLVAVHFLVDFYGGLLAPLPQPTLTTHLDTDIGRVALLVGGWALLVNLVQPLSGWLLPRRGLPIILLLGPPAAAFSALIGLNQSFAGVAALLLVSGIGIGVVHPEATLAVQSLGGKHAGAAVGLFMSVGYFGFALGGMVGGIWVEWRGLDRFWLLALPAILLTVIAAFNKLHRIDGHIAEHEKPAEQPVGFFPVFGLAIGVAVTMCLIIRFITILLVRRFPEAAAQGWGGTTVFATGVTGAIGAFLWGHISDRVGAARVLALLQLAALPLLWGLISVSRIGHAPVWGLGLGLTLGSAFPLVVVLARQARGFSQRLRMGLIIGGAWGLGETVFMFGGHWLKQFSETDPDPVARLLRGGLLVLTFNVLLAGYVAMRTPRRPLNNRRPQP